MSCNSTTPFVVFNTQFSQANCDACSDPACGGSAQNAACVFYAGAALPCSGIATNDNLETALQKIDAQVCAITGNYATYNTFCLAPITTQQEFVEGISEFVCTLRTDFDNFLNITYINGLATISTRFAAIEVPGITCAIAGVVPADTLNDILNKYCTSITALDTAISLSGVNWSQCFVSSTPTTIAQAFDLLIDQICLVNSNTGAALPVFNNIGSCLPTPGAADTLVSTIDKIKTRLCQTGTFDINALTWGCVTQPSVVTTDLQSAVQEILDQVNDYIQNKLTFSADFVVSLTNPLDVCEGKTVELTTPILSNDRLVASTNTDLTPGTLQDKLVAGLDVSLDFLSNPGQVIINSSAALTDTYQVKADITDAFPSFLINKVHGTTNNVDGVFIVESYNNTTKKVDLAPAIDWDIFINKWFDQVEADVALKIRFCTLVQDCVDQNFVCNGYTVSLTPAQILANASSSFSYTDCNNVIQVVNLSAPGFESVSFCALRNSITAVGLLVLDGGACVGSTTTTTTSTSTTTTTSTSSTTTTTTTAPGPPGVALTVKLGTPSEGDACAAGDTVVYSFTGLCTVGVALFTDALLTVPVTGFDYVWDTYGSAVTFNISSITGTVGAPAGVQC